ncbi:hypothetical protein L0F63_000963, partial [Massospora cicadina]
GEEEEKVPREQLRQLENWPITLMGVDCMKLETFLSALKWKMSSEKVMAIRTYIAHIHPLAPILDLDYFFHYITMPGKLQLKVLDDLVTLYKLFA